MKDIFKPDRREPTIDVKWCDSCKQKTPRSQGRCDFCVAWAVVRERKERGDRMGSRCECGGVFKETSIHDDWDGIVHCDECGKGIERCSNKENN